MIQGQIFIIPEINNPEEICDHTNQTANILKEKNIVYIYYCCLPPVPITKIFDGHNLRPAKILPFNRFRLIYKINIFITFQLLYIYIFIKHHLLPIYWIYYPQLTPLLRISLRPKFLIFDILDGFDSTPAENNWLLKRAKVVSVMTKTLLNHYQKYYQSANYLVTHPASYLETPAKYVDHKINRLISNKQYKVGYIGSINERIDFHLLSNLVKSTPNLCYLFAGPVNHDQNVKPKPVTKLFNRLIKLNNFYYLGQLPKNQIHHFLNIIDVGIIPYDSAEKFNQLSFPLKAIEYYQASKPIISTPISELFNFPKTIKIAKTATEFKSLILQKQNLPTTKKHPFKYYNWHHKVQLILNKLDSAT